MSVVDTTTRKVVQTLVLPARGIAVSPRDHSVYLATGRTATVLDGSGQVTSTIDLASNQPTATVIAVTD